jgi:hypothetical protein
MSARVGDRIVVEAERSSQSARQGVIEEILKEQPLRCRVHWDDGHESIFTPAAGAMWVKPKPRRSQARNR